MYKPYTFYINSVRYITILGLEMTDYLQATSVAQYHNVMPFSVMNDPQHPCDKVLQRQTDVDLYNAPVVEVAEHSIDDGIWTLKGTVNGEEFQLGPDEIIVGDYMIYPEMKQLERPAPAPEPEPVQEPVRTVQPAPASKAQTPEPEPQRSSTRGSRREIFGWGGRPEGLEGSKWVIGTNRVEANLTAKGHLPTPTRATKDIVRYKSDSYRERVHTAKQHVSEQPKNPITPPPLTAPIFKPTLSFEKSEPARVEVTPEETKELFEVAESVVSESVEPAPVPMDKQWSRSVKTEESVPEPTSVAPVVPAAISKEQKDEFRASLSPEVNKVIGDIPHSCLASIEAFTMSEIDMARLAEEGDLYCIDNRWHKCGKWYCIDIVNEASRYFYNSKLNVSIKIPTSTCKKWLSIVGGGGA